MASTRSKPATPSPAAKPRSYAEKRDFARTPEPRLAAKRRDGAASKPIFVVQKHAARRLHWDFRLEHGGVLWSWAVPKGPSMDPKDKRLAVHVEDHPVDYAEFEGTIPAGNYGAGTVELWDRGHWTARAEDPAAALAEGELKFSLEGDRLSGGFVLVRLKGRRGERGENWLLIKEHDAAEREGAAASVLEQKPPARPRKSRPASPKGSREAAPPEQQAPQLATLVSEPPVGPDWISEIKFDGYRMLCRKHGDAVTLITRNGLDWTDRVPQLARAVAALPARSCMLDGELVSLEKDGRSSFAALQDALAGSRTHGLFFYAFDLLHENGVDLRPLPLEERKRALAELLEAATETGPIRISEHLTSETARVRSEACKAGLEGIICKRLDAPYRPGRGQDWLKLKCEDREEFVIVGFTPPKGARQGLGALQVARYDKSGKLCFAGGVGTGFSASSLRQLRERLDGLATRTPPRNLQNSKGAPKSTSWVKPELVAEIRFAGITPDGMLRHAIFLGLREDKPAREVVIATAPKARGTREIGGQRLTNPDRLLWPGAGGDQGVTKADLAEYWRTVAQRALPGIANRPLAFVRCPDGIEGEHFFQKHKNRGMPDAIREGTFDDAPYLELSGLDGLLAASQIAAIELHGWGSSLDDAGHADQLVFDLDPGEGTPFADVIAAAKDVRKRLKATGLESYPRTSGGKGLHVVAPVRTDAGWDSVRAWCRRFAERMERDAPERYVSTTRKSRRVGRILIDWLRNGLGSTAIASYSPRARPGATVATPLSWREVTDTLDPARFTIRTVPARLRAADPWRNFASDRRVLDPKGQD
jgi:bifunctional non-homologous end joining protein LigD